jgi:hypothetical protein
MTAAREYWAEQVREHRDEQGRAFRYVHVRHPGAQGLIVHFSAFFGEWGEARQHRRVFSGHFHRLRMLGDVADYDWLFVCDEYGADGNGTYYTGESGDMFIERAMLDLIRSVAADFEVITPGGFTVIDVEDHVGPGRPIPSDGVDVLGIFHMTPTRFLGQDAIDIELSAIFDQVSVSDEYIEYHSREWSVAAGLAYQSIPMNDPRFGGTRSTLMQSPKLLVDEQTDTHLVLLNISTSPDYNLDISFDLAFIAADGDRVANHTVRIPAYGFARVSTRDVLRSAGVFERFVEGGGNGMVVGFSDKGSVVPLSITRNDRSKGLACDHTLPPMYYLPWWGGEVRKAANQRVRELLFSRSEHPPR